MFKWVALGLGALYVGCVAVLTFQMFKAMKMSSEFWSIVKEENDV